MIKEVASAAPRSLREGRLKECVAKEAFSLFMVFLPVDLRFSKIKFILFQISKRLPELQIANGRRRGCGNSLLTGA